MTRTEFRALCAALGFVAVVVKDNVPPQDRALRAVHLARLIEAFCRATVPEAFGAETARTASEQHEEREEDQAEDDMLVVDIHGTDNTFALHGRMATAIVAIMKERGECSPRDLAAKGFTPEEIERCWPMAKALAHVELNWMDS